MTCKMITGINNVRERSNLQGYFLFLAGMTKPHFIIFLNQTRKGVDLTRTLA